LQVVAVGYRAATTHPIVGNDLLVEYGLGTRVPIRLWLLAHDFLLRGSFQKTHVKAVENGRAAARSEVSGAFA
jgi:hypothetical protein